MFFFSEIKFFNMMLLSESARGERKKERERGERV
jgi:hypothetical protein